MAARLPLPAAHAISVALHAAAFAALAGRPMPPATTVEAVSVEILEVEPPPPPPPAEPAPVARALLAPPRAAPRAPSPAPSAPPPPSTPPPPDAAPPSRAPVRIGVSLSSTTTSGGVAVPVGNTLLGDLPARAPDPASVRPYRSDRYVPPTRVTVLPRPDGDCAPPKEDYPEEALRLGIEGRVVLSLTVDETGAIADARVVEDPGHGFGAAALAAVRRHCRFLPGRRDGEPVATDIRYKVTFVLP